MSNTKNTHYHQEVYPNPYIGATPFINKQPNKPKTLVAPSLEVSGVIPEASEENSHSLTEKHLQNLLNQAAELGAKKALNELEDNKRHLMYEKYRFSHKNAAKYLGVSARTLTRNRDLWCLDYHQEKKGSQTFYTKASLDIYIQNRS